MQFVNTHFKANAIVNYAENQKKITFATYVVSPSGTKFVPIITLGHKLSHTNDRLFKIDDLTGMRMYY